MIYTLEERVLPAPADMVILLLIYKEWDLNNRGVKAHKIYCGLAQGYNVRKVNCSCVYSAYTLKPVLSGRKL